MKTLLLITLALFSLQVSAQTWIPVPDPNFQNYLTTHYPAGAFMTSGGNFFIDADHADIQTEDSLEISGLSIASIEGVQAFGNLVFLNCYNNDLTALPVSLPANLTNFNCGNNQLTQLPVLPVNLVQFSCNSNQLTALPALPPSLFLLNCTDNLLTSLPNFPGSLEFLQCGQNLLTTLPNLPSQMNYLSCGENNLTSLPVLPQTLHLLACNSNNLVSLPLLPNNLNTIYCGENQLTTLPDLPLNLNVFDCQWNQLTELPDLPQSLNYLNCDSNYLSVLPDLPDQLTSLICNRNQLTEITELPSTLTYFHCYNNQINCFVEFPSSIQMFNIDNNPFTCLPNYIPAMGAGDLSYPLCGPGNLNGCPVATGITGTVFHDVNNDCIPAAQTLTYVPMSVYDSNGTLITSSTSLANGDYYFAAVPGTYALSVDTANLTQGVQVTCPVGNSSAVIIPVSDTVVPGGDFGLVCNGFDLGVQSIVHDGLVFPGQTHGVAILAGDLTAQYNMYCASGISGEVTIAVTGPGTVTFGGAPTNVSGNVAVYSIADFGIANANSFLASILTNTTAQGGDDFCVTVSVATAASGELNASNNSYTYCYHVVNSYDPNIKETYPEFVEPGYADEFTYTIHFQNTGSAPAITIRLADVLDQNLDLSTLKIMNASAEYNITLDASTRLLSVRFPNIMLPDSASDPQGSIGFIQYRVKPLPGLTNGTTIHNTASIYFDYNAPIITNTTGNLFTTDLGLEEMNARTVQLYPNPAENELFVKSDNKIEQVSLYDLKGTLVKTLSLNAKQTSLDISILKSGVYLVSIHTNQSVITKRLIVR